MDVDLAALPDDVDALHRLIRDLAADRAGERTALSEAQAEIERTTGKGAKAIAFQMIPLSLTVAPIEVG